VQNKVVTSALNARPTKAQIDEGWWSEWTVACSGTDVTAQVPQPERFLSDVLGWDVPTEYPTTSFGDTLYDETTGYGDDTVLLEWTSSAGDWTATRHRVAAPVPIKTRDLTNDGSDGEHPFISQNEVQHQQLTPVYSQTPTFTEWVWEVGLDAPQPTYIGANIWQAVIPSMGGILEADGAEDAISLSFSGGIATATRERTDIIGYTLGDQTTKPLQPQGDYAVKSDMSVTPGTGANADKATIQLKTGTSATVLTEHQDLRYTMVTPTLSISTTDNSDDTAAVQLQDRAMNQVTLGAGIAYATLTFPANETGKARDFFVRLTITGSDVPTIYFKEQGGASVAFDVDDDSWAEIEQGVNVMMFSDTSEASA
jgi:hypothetical protein